MGEVELTHEVASFRCSTDPPSDASPSHIRASAMPSRFVNGVIAKSDQAIGFVGGIVKLTRFEASGFTI